MSSEVEIYNLALAHLGDTANVASPDESSVQAELCSRFYPIARNALLEMPDCDWNFATRRATLALLGSDVVAWDYAYAYPSDAVRLISVLAPDAGDDQEIQPYALELDSADRRVIYTDQAEAVVRYIALVEDTTRFSQLFTTTLTWSLASLLAGPILKGDAGVAEAKRCASMAAAWLAKASVSDANQRRGSTPHTPAFLAGR